MFKIKIAILSMLWLATAAFLVQHVAFLDSNLTIAYQQVMEQQGKKEAKRGNCKQQRLGVFKHIFFNRGGEAEQVFIQSARSELVLNQQEGQAALIEYFDDVCCAAQEKLCLDCQKQPGAVSQIIRHLTAATALYHYQTGKLTAQQVKLVRYQAPGNILKIDIPAEATSLMTGEASEMEFSLMEESIFKAKEFKGSMPLSGSKI